MSNKKMERMRHLKKLMSILFLSLLLLLFVACSNSTSSNNTNNNGDVNGTDNNSSEQTDELIIFNWSEYMPDEILEEFEEEYGIKVVYSTFSSNQEMLSKIKSGTVPYDIAVPSDFYVKVMADEGLLLEIDYDNIPNFGNIADEWKDLEYDPENKFSVPYLYGYDGIIYNKSIITDPPTSWGDLWNPEYAGHVVLMDAADEISDMLQQYLGNDMNDPTEEQIEAGGDKLKELIPNILLFSETPEPQLVSEEAWIAYGYSGEAGVAYLENEDIDFVLPEEGGIKWTDNMVIPNSAANKYNAELFINYLLRPEVSKQLVEEYPYGNPNTKALELLDDEEFSQIPGQSLPKEQTDKAQWSHNLDPDRTQIVNRVIQKAKIEGGN